MLIFSLLFNYQVLVDNLRKQKMNQNFYLKLYSETKNIKKIIVFCAKSW